MEKDRQFEILIGRIDEAKRDMLDRMNLHRDEHHKAIIELRRDVKDLSGFKMKALGVCMGVSFVFVYGMKIAVEVFKLI